MLFGRDSDARGSALAEIATAAVADDARTGMAVAGAALGAATVPLVELTRAVSMGRERATGASFEARREGSPGLKRWASGELGRAPLVAPLGRPTSGMVTREFDAKLPRGAGAELPRVGGGELARGAVGELGRWVPFELARIAGELGRCVPFELAR